MYIDLELWKKRKKELNFTYDDIALKSGVSRRTIIRIFSNDNCNPTNFNITAIEKALGINQENLLDKTNETLTKDESTVIKLFNSLDRKKLVLEILKNLS